MRRRRTATAAAIARPYGPALVQGTSGHDGAAGVDRPPPGGRGGACRNCDVCDVPHDGRLLPRRVVDGPFDPDVVRGDRDEMRRGVDWDGRGHAVGGVGGVDIRPAPAAVPLRAVNVEEESGLAV